MANEQVQLRRGTTAENDAFTGAEGELVYDTEKKQLRIHDGERVGGHQISTKFPVPDYSKEVQIAAAGSAIGTYNVAENGIIIGNMDGAAGSPVYVNGFVAVVSGNDSGNEGPFYVPVCVGDTVTCTTATRGVYFIPYKFVEIKE